MTELSEKKNKTKQNKRKTYGDERVTVSGYANKTFLNAIEKMANLTGVKHTTQLQESLKLSNCEINMAATVYSM